MKSHNDEEIDDGQSEYEPKLKKKKIEDHLNNDDDRTRLVFLDGIEKHYMNSLLCKKLCNPSTITCLEGAKLVVRRTFETSDGISCIQIHQKKQWLLVVTCLKDDSDHIGFKIISLESGVTLHSFRLEIDNDVYGMYVVESEHGDNDIVFLYSHREVLKIKLDPERDLPILNHRSFLQFGDITDLKFIESRNELFVGFTNQLLVFDGEFFVKTKFASESELYRTYYTHYNPIHDQLFVFSNNYPEHVLRKYYGPNFSESEMVMYVDLDDSIGLAELLFEMELDKFYVMRVEDDLFLIEKSNHLLLQKIETDLLIENYSYDRASKTIFGYTRERKVYQLELQLDTYSIDKPLEEDVCLKLEKLGLNLPRVIVKESNTPNAVSFLKQMRSEPKPFAELQFEGVANQSLISEYYEIIENKPVRLDKVRGVHYDFSFNFKTIVQEYLKGHFPTKFPNDEVFLIGGHSVRCDKYCIGVLLSDLHQNGQYLTDFPILVIREKNIFKCKLSDFLGTLKPCISVKLKRDDDTKEFKFKLQEVYEALKNNSLISQISLELNPTILLKSYRNVATKPQFSTLLQVSQELKEHIVTINKTEYLLVDLLVMAQASGKRELIQFQTETFYDSENDE